MQKICIVIPCYNEENRFPVVEFNDFYKATESICFCFVNDGSIDNTSGVLNNLRKGRDNRILFIELKKNQGKAEAVRNGILKSLEWKNFDYIGYFDADLSTPLPEIFLLEESLRQKSIYQMAFGSRVMLLGVLIKRNACRHYLSRIFASLASSLLKLPIYDTQCGAKLIKAELASKIFTKPFVTRWLFDIEIFARIINFYGYEEAKNIMKYLPTW